MSVFIAIVTDHHRFLYMDTAVSAGFSGIGMVDGACGRSKVRRTTVVFLLVH